MEAKIREFVIHFCLTTLCTVVLVAALSPAARVRRSNLGGFKTNTDKRTIDLNELRGGGPGKDGIPAIRRPKFISARKNVRWLKPAEPVISLTVKDKARAYPLQILIWHEMVNDRIGDVPVLVTFCPLCYTAIVFERTIDDKEYTFGVSGMLRYSNLVMYDRQSESLWQQATGEAVVGDMVGRKLNTLPAQIISYEQFRRAYPEGLVLSRNTGFKRDYGRNPYVGYDDINNRPLGYQGQFDDRVAPMEKLITVTIKKTHKAYPYSITSKRRVINDQVVDVPIAVLHTEGALSALDAERTAYSRPSGSTGVFDRRLDEKTLSFKADSRLFVDKETGSTWNITGKAIAGPLAGKQLKPIAHGDYFAFTWLIFRPKTEIYSQP
ncbi:MAG: DUF3179 domain-containing protein [Planctomycetota bacterium]|jgi:hypothetical protein